MERNLCLESGCLGYCCQDNFLEVTESERNRLFKDAKYVPSKDDLLDIQEDKIPGVFYTKHSRKELEPGIFFMLYISGPCPHRLSNGSCSQHIERSHAARNLLIGSKECNDIRSDHGLPPISTDLTK